MDTHRVIVMLRGSSVLISVERGLGSLPWDPATSCGPNAQMELEPETVRHCRVQCRGLASYCVVCDESHPLHPRIALAQVQEQVQLAGVSLA